MTEVQPLLQQIQTQQAAFSAARSLYGERFAPEFSLFQFVATHELGLSNILAWMLNPKASHAQGARFLAALVQQFSLPWDQSACEQAMVRTEVPISVGDDPRRIDILIQSGNQSIAIENKPWAEDQPGQVAAYLQYLDGRFRGSRCLIYISGHGGTPSSGSITTEQAAIRHAAGELHISQYEALLPWIEACRSMCRADRVSAFLDEFRRFIQGRFMGVRDVTERDRIVAEMTRTPEAISASFQVIQQADAMKTALLKTLEAQLRDEAQKRGWTVTQRQSERVKGSGFLIKFHEGDDVSFALGFNDDQRAGVSYGVVGLEQNHGEYDSIHQVIRRIFGSGEKWERWVWGKVVSPQDENLPIETDWSRSDRPWMAILEKGQPMTTAIIAAASKVEVALSEWQTSKDAAQRTSAGDLAGQNIATAVIC